jgi:hypothetical protein
MRDSRVRLLLWSSAALLGAGAAAIVAWGLGDPPGVVAAGAGAVARPATAPAGSADPPLEAFEEVWDGELGQPLVPTARPAAAAVAAVAAPPPVPVKLLGTAVEPGRSMAALAGPDGRPQWRQVGESVAGAQVLRIDPDQVTVRHGGVAVTLRVQKPATAGSPAGGVPASGPPTFRAPAGGLFGADPSSPVPAARPLGRAAPAAGVDRAGKDVDG